MKNFWVQRRSELASWCGDLAAIAESPEVVSSLFLQVVELGVRHGITIVDVAEVRARIQARWQADTRIDARIAADLGPRSRLCWYDRNDEVTEGEVSDLGMLLRTLEPADGAISRYVSDVGSPPLAVSGSIFRYRDGRLVRGIGDQVLLFTTHSDIWFPFVTGDAHPSWDGESYFDNRDLANRHTPRLNAFLDEVASAVEAAGGRWSIEAECVARTLAPWVTERGIRLDGPVPPLMPPELVDVPWPALDDA